MTRFIYDYTQFIAGLAHIKRRDDTAIAIGDAGRCRTMPIDNALSTDMFCCGSGMP